MAQENGASLQTDNVSSSPHISGRILRSSKLPSRKAWLGCTRASRPRSYDLLLVAECCCWVSDFFSALLLRLTMGGQWWKRCLLCSETILALPMSNWLMCVFAYARDLFPMQFCHFWRSSSIVRCCRLGGGVVPFQSTSQQLFSDRALIMSRLQPLDHYSLSDYSHDYHVDLPND